MKARLTLNRIFVVLLVIAFLVIQPAFAKSENPVPGTVPGTVPVGQTNSLSILSSYPVTPHSIVPEITEVGKISWSIDGLGTTDTTGTIQVEKPAGATVKSAYMFAATMGISGYHLAAGDILIDGTPVTWDIADIPTNPPLNSFNYMGDVTSIVKTKIDSAPAGRVDFTITEGPTESIDGEILVVIFNDPNQATDNTIVLLFGAQKQTGDDFNIGLGEPLDLSDPEFAIDFSLGISFSFQPGQNSIIDVNGARITSSAGGDDDGTGPLANGELLTVGGLDDATTNPADPNGNGDTRYDDELYTLLPFVNTGDTQILVHSQNPSNDDNIFFAGLFIRSATAVVGEGIILSPASATNPLNTQHTVTAKVQDETGAPIVGQEVTFEITAGPNSGVTGTGTTDINGEATFSYTGTVAGTDTIVARFVDTVTITSNEATKTWTGESPISTPEFPSIFLPAMMTLGFLGTVMLIQRTREH